MHRLEAHSGDLERHLCAGARGDVTAFTQLYDAVAPRVYGLALRILDDVRAAEEVTEAAMMQIWQSAARFDPAEESALSWMMAVAHRTAVDHARAARPAGPHAVRASDPDSPTGVVSTAWRHLSAEHRGALELAYFGGRTHLEITQSLALPMDTAKNRIRDGLLELKILLEPSH